MKEQKKHFIKGVISEIQDRIKKIQRTGKAGGYVSILDLEEWAKVLKWALEE